MPAFYILNQMNVDFNIKFAEFIELWLKNPKVDFLFPFYSLGKDSSRYNYTFIYVKK